MLQVVVLDVGDELGVGHHPGAEHRHPSGHGQHALGQGHRAHVDVALGEAQLVPLAHHVAALHFAEFIGGEAADVGEELEPGHGLLHHAVVEHGVAVDHRDHRVVVRQVPGNRAEAIGQAVALAGAGNPHEVEADPVRRVHLLPQRTDQDLVGHLDDGADHGGRVAAVDGFADHRAIDHGSGQGVDAETGDHQEHVRRVGRAAQLAHAPAVVRVDHVEEQHAAQEVHAAHGVAPDADGADKQDEILGVGVEHGLRHCQREHHQQAEEHQPAGGFGEATFVSFHHQFHRAGDLGLDAGVRLLLLWRTPRRRPSVRGR
ncbi:Uncharacterised protein [Klebsiella pneumoniae]|nr:Uncharacterised protein [Klebsiella pneumoniae]